MEGVLRHALVDTLVQVTVPANVDRNETTLQRETHTHVQAATVRVYPSGRSRCVLMYRQVFALVFALSTHIRGNNETTYVKGKHGIVFTSCFDDIAQRENRAKLVVFVVFVVRAVRQIR